MFWQITTAAKDGFWVNNDFKREFRTKKTMMNHAKLKGYDNISAVKLLPDTPVATETNVALLTVKLNTKFWNGLALKKYLR